jgi:hypothetical protein
MPNWHFAVRGGIFQCEVNCLSECLQTTLKWVDTLPRCFPTFPGLDAPMQGWEAAGRHARPPFLLLSITHFGSLPIFRGMSCEETMSASGSGWSSDSGSGWDTSSDSDWVEEITTTRERRKSKAKKPARQNKRKKHKAKDTKRKLFSPPVSRYV